MVGSLQLWADTHIKLLLAAIQSRILILLIITQLSCKFKASVLFYCKIWNVSYFVLSRALDEHNFFGTEIRHLFSIGVLYLKAPLQTSLKFILFYCNTGRKEVTGACSSGIQKSCLQLISVLSTFFWVWSFQLKSPYPGFLPCKNGGDNVCLPNRDTC